VSWLYSQDKTFYAPGTQICQDNWGGECVSVKENILKMSDGILFVKKKKKKSPGHI
jgi:hypothetical protein